MRKGLIAAIVIFVVAGSSRPSYAGAAKDAPRQHQSAFTVELEKEVELKTPPTALAPAINPVLTSPSLADRAKALAEAVRTGAVGQWIGGPSPRVTGVLAGPGRLGGNQQHEYVLVTLYAF